jgi:predicted RNase H-like HicB family nuclease
MKFEVVVHEAEEGGYWAEVPAVPGCASQGDTMDELMANIREAIEGRLSVDIEQPTVSDGPKAHRRDRCLTTSRAYRLLVRSRGVGGLCSGYRAVTTSLGSRVRSIEGSG